MTKAQKRVYRDNSRHVTYISSALRAGLLTQKAIKEHGWDTNRLIPWLISNYQAEDKLSPDGKAIKKRPFAVALLKLAAAASDTKGDGTGEQLYTAKQISEMPSEQQRVYINRALEILALSAGG